MSGGDHMRPPDFTYTRFTSIVKYIWALLAPETTVDGRTPVALIFARLRCSLQSLSSPRKGVANTGGAIILKPNNTGGAILLN